MQSMNQRLEQFSLGKHERLVAVSGGQINQSYYLKTTAGEWFIKCNDTVTADFFDFEVYGLALLRQTGTVKTPKVIAQSSDTLVLEWLTPAQTKEAEAHLGQTLAQLHQQPHLHYGLGRDGYIGTLLQPNQLLDDWLTYYRDFRLMNQRKIGIERGTLSGMRLNRLDTLLSKLERYIPKNPGASLLHGDLWGGNWISTAANQAYVIDPAVVYGDRYFELSYTELFGGFSSDFYHHYQEMMPIESDYQAVKPLYQLFFLLVHLNIFGERYGPAVDRILADFT
ncbi:fructosamine-3-kinase [Streptohalobacillus salinus]|uniref:Fructosamine-3-kinase n=1 Tax=Streptohalobacillus salinus TaxID=621096 RepID=A0A2V3WTE1_9BACI|nr:fructosamine kinase family protein [Streptohalobacillus salinus]PXW92081.1 fructosamine-3-kinase [Streptohalobacillus salinus]